MNNKGIITLNTFTRKEREKIIKPKLTKREKIQWSSLPVTCQHRYL